MQELYGKEIVATTLQGLEQVLERELQQLGAQQTEIIKRGVVCRFNKSLLYKANMACRTALRFLVPVIKFEATDPDDLYRKATGIAWEQFMEVKQSFAISFVVNAPEFPHGQYAALKLKDAICDRFRDRSGSRPSVDTEQPDIAWHLHVFRNQVTISLDSSGTSLHIRGYRNGNHPAPMNEVLAAGLIQLANWDSRFTPFVDGMCGSGTIAIEAASLAAARAPHLHRKHFPFKQWPDFERKFWEEARDQLIKASRSELPPIRAYDKSPQAIRMAEMHADQAGVGKHIRFERVSFFETKADTPKGLVLLNPPYGERMTSDALHSLYQSIGDTFKHQYKGWQAGVISSDKDLLKAIRLHSKHTVHLLNGKLPADFKLYDLY